MLADDLGYGDINHLNLDRGRIPTPHVDSLAREGMTCEWTSTDRTRDQARAGARRQRAGRNLLPPKVCNNKESKHGRKFTEPTKLP